MGRKSNADKTSSPSEDPLQNPHEIKENLFTDINLIRKQRDQPGRDTTIPSQALNMSRHNQNQQQGNNHYRSPKATSRALHHTRNPPGKGEPDREGGRHSCNGCMCPHQTGDRTNPTVPPHTTPKTSPKARVEGAKFGVPGMPRGGQGKLRTRHEARRAWRKHTNKSSEPKRGRNA